jgi:4-hydroxybenzoate polyprenyltransferase
MEIKKYLELIRINQWIKNLLVFVPIFFALKFNFENFYHVFLVFISFSFTASSVYIINDVFDLEFDKKHPQKKLRPIASNKITIKKAAIVSLITLVLGIAVSLFINRTVFYLIASYFIINLLYSKWLKYVPIIEVMVISIGFILRIMAGAAAVSITVSSWIMVCTFFGALFLGFGKRKSEISNLKEESEKTRGILAFYEYNFINQLLGLSAGVTIMSYTLYTMDLATINHFKTKELIYTIPFVVFGLCRYFQIIYTKSSGENPSRVFLTDLPIFINSMLWIVSFGIIIYFN